MRLMQQSTTFVFQLSLGETYKSINNIVK